MADGNPAYLSHSSADWSNDEFSDNDESSCSENNCSERDKISQTDQQYNSITDFTKANDNEEIVNMKHQLEILKKRVCCLLKINCQLQHELDKSTQTNLILEQYITCPYVVNKGKIEFPGKNDLEKRFNCMVKALDNIKTDLKIIQNDNYLACKLDKGTLIYNLDYFSGRRSTEYVRQDFSKLLSNAVDSAALLTH